MPSSESSSLCGRYYVLRQRQQKKFWGTQRYPQLLWGTFRPVHQQRQLGHNFLPSDTSCTETGDQRQASNPQGRWSWQVSRPPGFLWKKKAWHIFLYCRSYPIEGPGMVNKIPILGGKACYAPKCPIAHPFVLYDVLQTTGVPMQTNPVCCYSLLVGQQWEHQEDGLDVVGNNSDS